jgi:hypothetical protein
MTTDTIERTQGEIAQEYQADGGGLPEKIKHQAQRVGAEAQHTSARTDRRVALLAMLVLTVAAVAIVVVLMAQRRDNGPRAAAARRLEEYVQQVGDRLEQVGDRLPTS